MRTGTDLECVYSVTSFIEGVHEMHSATVNFTYVFPFLDDSAIGMTNPI